MSRTRAGETPVPAARLSARGDIAAAKIADRGDATEFGKQRRVDDLRGVSGVGPVTHRLAMTADSRDVVRVKSGLREQREYGGGVGMRKLLGGQRRAMQFVVARLIQAEQSVAQGWRERLVVTMSERCRAAGGIKARDHGIDAVETGAGHQPDERIGHA